MAQDIINIALPSSELPLLEEFYKERIDLKKKELAALEATLTRILTPVLSSQVVVNNIAPTLATDGYNPSWTWQQKINHILVNGALTTTQVVAKVLEYEPDKAEDRGKVVASVSAMLSSKSKTATDPYIKRLNDRNENIYGLNSQYTSEFVRENSNTSDLQGLPSIIAKTNGKYYGGEIFTPNKPQETIEYDHEPLREEDIDKW